ncbi:hypothetical protein K432DRAFT_300870 [Lepidopterella palustris CBS 459.81]|uniref:Sister chromatid cohesion protein Dcc1 n=1 Tax=Lepidopterella palustris CBS 459.81 TaxID=1314670 RepID=A0A8E2E839_9PEZI|nr:hypothetical protein K432DRAFT_300870 [Lepidopterella palustris CBS 459.81]
MATQDERGVPFSIAHEQQQFRLLELPPEILQLIDSPNPPVLSVKSQVSPVASSTPDSKPAYAVLCTRDQTFQLRQVQTSNSVFVTQPVFETHGDEIPIPGLSAISSCTTTLELHAVAASPLPFLKDALLVWDSNDGMVDAAGNGQSKRALFSNIPLSDGECETGWQELAAFELAGSSFRPSLKTQLQVWQSINAAALAESINLGSQFLTEDLINAMEDEGYPSSLIAALLQLLAAEEKDTRAAWSCLDPKKCVTWTGKSILEVKQSDPELLTATFLDAWKDCLPEAWRDDAELETIKDAYVLPTPTTIAFKADPETVKVANDAAARAGSSSRKWHEKFARARRR